MKSQTHIILASALAALLLWGCTTNSIRIGSLKAGRVQIYQEPLQTNLPGIFSNQRGAKVAASFLLASQAAATHVTWHGYYGTNLMPGRMSGRFILSLFPDSSGAPATTPLFTQTVQANVRPTKQQLNTPGKPFDGHPIYRFDASLSPPMLINAGTMNWLSIAADDPSMGQWLWARSAAGSTRLATGMTNRQPQWQTRQGLGQTAFELEGIALLARDDRAAATHSGKITAKPEKGDAAIQLTSGGIKISPLEVDAGVFYDWALKYARGREVATNYEEAVRWYRKAAERNHAMAQNNLGVCYYRGRGVETNYEAAVHWYRKAADQTNAWGLYNLGWCYAHGRGVPTNHEEAVNWYRKAAERNHIKAQTYLGVCYARGRGVQKNYAEAVNWYRKAAEQNDAEAQNYLGWSYVVGEGVATNYVEALKWLRKAAGRNHARAKNNLGVCCFRGWGVPTNHAEAVNWYRKAAEQNDSWGQYNLGWCYAQGIAMPPDYVEAVKWLRKSAEQNNLSAQKYLGWCYALGQGVPRNEDEALKWYGKAAAQNDAEAQRYLDSRAMRGRSLPGSATVMGSADDIKVTGTVIDAETREPVPLFTVVEGRKSPFGEQTDWTISRKTCQSNGAFTVYFTKQRQPPAVLIEAEGYIPQSSGFISTNGTNVTITLKRGSGPAGVVLKPDGRPATNTTVYLADMKNAVYVDSNDGKFRVREEIYRSARNTRTDAQGAFSFPPQIDSFAIIVIDEAGYAEVPVSQLQKPAEVRLQPFARIEGQLLIGRHPGANETIRLGMAHIPYAEHPRIFPPLSLFLTTSTDDNGKFVFEQVPPIAVEVYHEPKVRGSRMGAIPQSQTTKFQLEPGEKRQLVLGGKGRPVVGRLVVNGYDGKIDYRADVQSLESILPQPPEMPDPMTRSKEFAAKFRSLTTEEAKKAALEEYKKQSEAAQEELRAFYRTEAGRQYCFAKRRFALNFSQDGSFRIEDVPGGKYNLRIDLREGGGDMPSRFSSSPIANLTKEIEVPDSPGGRSDEPFDLGKLEVTARGSLKAGKAAPDFEVKTLDGKPLKLADFKGKYLLLDFWAVWCGPCVAETPHLKAVWDAFKDNPRFAMVGLSLDPAAAAPRNYTAKNEIGWTQGFLGEWSKSGVPERYGVQGIPAIFLIGPDGKILATGLRGEAIKAAVQAALHKP